MLSPYNRETLRQTFAVAKPVPHVVIDNFLDHAAAKKIADAYPDFDTALSQGQTFSTVSERKKVQVTDKAKFSAPVAELNDLLSSKTFLNDLSYITGMPKLLADDQLLGGGIHMTGPGGRLDVHVDFNFIEDRKLHRRLNLLLYLNDPWQSDWGGQFQLWDKDVTDCEAVFDPILNRCVIFETNEISFHGVVPVSPLAPAPRKSFAAYYYTKEAPAHWTGVSHSTIFKARPEEKLKGTILLPAETIKNTVLRGLRSVKTSVREIIGR